MDLAALTTIWNTLRDQLAAATGLDEEELLDSLDGELDLGDRLRALIRKRRELLAHADALKVLIREQQDRLARMERTARNIGDAVTTAMCEAGLKKLTAPDFSVSVGYGRAPITGLEQLDPDALPPQFVRIKKEVNKVVLRTALEEGEHIEGVYLGNPQPHLTVRKT